MRRASIFLTVLVLVLGITRPLDADFHFGAYDPAQWHGLVLVKEGDPFAFRFAIFKGDEKIDGYDTFFIVDRPGPFAPDGSYAEVSFNPFLPIGKGRETPLRVKGGPPDRLLTLRYSRWGDGLVGSLSIPAGIRIETVFYSPWPAPVDYRDQGGQVTGNKDNMVFRFLPVGSAFEKLEVKEKSLVGRVKEGLSRFYFYAGFAGPGLSPQEIDTILQTNRDIYQAKRPRVTGEWPGLIDSISDNLGWMKLFQPDSGEIYLPAGRRWIFPGPDGQDDLWTIFEWDAFFNALEAAVEDPQLARREIAAVLDCQYPNGNIPNWRSSRSGTPDRSQPPVGAFAVLKTYYRLGDISLLEEAYGRLKKWHRYWTDPGKNGTPRRDGNGDCLLEWGSDTELMLAGCPEWEKGVEGRQRAAWESGQDDLPNYDNVPFDDRANTLKMNCIDLSALYALDAEMLMTMAQILGKTGDAEVFKREYEEIKARVNRVLWNENFYFDRYWDGRFSTQQAASNFYPLLAGLASADQAQAILKQLLDKQKFNGQYVIPTISRDHPAFKDQQYWRGTIWPPTNYLVYQGLKRYRFDEAAAELARKSAALFLESWNTHALCRENYHSVTGEGGGQRYQSWGPLFALILLEDFIDISPFDGLRVGNLAAGGKNRIENLVLREKSYDLDIDASGLSIKGAGQEIFRFQGRGVMRHIGFGPGFLEAEVSVTGHKMVLSPSILAGRRYTLEMDGKIAGPRKGKFAIPGGTHRIVLKEVK